MPTVSLSHQYKASPTKVFHAWSDSKNFQQWFAPDPAMKSIVSEFDFRVGGRYTINMQAPDGGDNIVSGEFLEIIPNKKIVMTWQWQQSQMAEVDEETTLTIEFHEKSGGTELTLLHENHATQKSAEMHTQGWSAILKRLEGIVA